MEQLTQDAYNHLGMLRHATDQRVDLIRHYAKPIIHLTYLHTYYVINTKRITSFARLHC